MSDNRATRSSRLVDELTEAAKRLGFDVRRERILREVGYRARGGACRLREKYLIIIDRDQPPAEQLEVLVEALRGPRLGAVIPIAGGATDPAVRFRADLAETS